SLRRLPERLPGLPQDWRRRLQRRLLRADGGGAAAAARRVGAGTVAPACLVALRRMHGGLSREDPAARAAARPAARPGRGARRAVVGAARIRAVVVRLV